MFAAATAELTKITLVQDLTAVMLAAGIVAALFHKLGWPKVIGYIAAGALMALPFWKDSLIANPESIRVLANLGVIFLMFALGLGLNIRKLKKISGTCFPSALVDLLIMLTVGYAVGKHIFGWRAVPCIFLGAVLCDSSTTLLAKSLEEMGCMKQKFASVIFGITLTEDILTIGVIAVLTGLALTGQFQATQLSIQLGYLGLFLTSVTIFGFALLPRILNWLSRMKDDETLLMIVLGICFGISLLAECLEFTLALGAFLVGAVVAESSVSRRVYQSTQGLRSMFSAVFFVTIGLMVDLPQMWQNIGMILLLTGVVLFWKTLNNSLVPYLCGQNYKEALTIGVGLAQLGDFSYLVALMGLNFSKGAAPYPQMYQVAVGVSILTTLLNPFLLKGTIPLGTWLDRHLPPRILHPMQRYTQWAQRAQTAVTTSTPEAKKMRHTLLWYGMDLGLIFLILTITHLLGERKIFWLKAPPWLQENRLLVVWLIALVFTAPIFTAIFCRVLRFSKMLSLKLVPPAPNENKADIHRRNLYGVLAAATGLVIVLFEVLVLIPMLFFKDLHNPWLFFAVFFLILLVCFLTRKHLKKIAEGGYDSLTRVLEERTEELLQEETDSEPLQELQRMIKIPENSGAVGKKLAVLRLRNRAGVSILAIHRQDDTMLTTPGGQDQLQTGDTLILMGTPDAYRKLESLLALPEWPADEVIPAGKLAQAKTQTYPLPSESRFTGYTLSRLHLRNRTGASIVQIQRRDGTVLSNPGADDTLHSGDQLTLLGTPEQLRQAETLLNQSQDSTPLLFGPFGK